MTNNNQYQHLSCAFAEQAVAYLYDEIDEAEKLNFESHLQSCRNCADEFADFSMLHSAISQWRTTDFETLPTPVFVLPGNRRKIVSEKTSWFENIRAYLAFSPVWMTAATLAALIICCGLFWFVTDFAPDKNVAENKKQPLQNSIATPSTENSDDSKILASNVNPAMTNDKSSLTTVKVKDGVRQNETVPNKNIAATSAKTNKLNKMPAPFLAKNLRPKNSVKDDVPSLAVDDTEEDALRLSDIFDEVGMINKNEVKKNE